MIGRPMAGDSTLSHIGPVTAVMPTNKDANAMFEENGTALLVTEIHHRVMNSFQVISALAHRCSRVREINDLPPILDDLADRLAAFAAVHRQLAMPPSGCFADHCSTLGMNLVAAFGRSDTIHVGMDAIDLPERWLSQVALIVAELLTNCLKHSLRSTASGSIRLDLHVSHGQLVIEAQDSAAGPISKRPPEPSRVVSALSASLGGDACIVDRQGYCAQVTLPLTGHEGRAIGRPHDADPAQLSSIMDRTVSKALAMEALDVRH
ncbi:histidine kinase dimerization/phosphoacceptor domain -containing protein [Sphingomonas sp. CARO-RG-8B-R24-01]|uniref:sensor histidine kinase n=1 Tax=Sphingomonas sp. CARO-RG-8B-R24-01 TaxID=2914831 RepID=UPI001F571CAD